MCSTNLTRAPGDARVAWSRKALSSSAHLFMYLLLCGVWGDGGGLGQYWRPRPRGLAKFCCPLSWVISQARRWYAEFKLSTCPVRLMTFWLSRSIGEGGGLDISGGGVGISGGGVGKSGRGDVVWGAQWAALPHVVCGWLFSWRPLLLCSPCGFDVMLFLGRSLTWGPRF